MEHQSPHSVHHTHVEGGPYEWLGKRLLRGRALFGGVVFICDVLVGVIFTR